MTYIRLHVNNMDSLNSKDSLLTEGGSYSRRHWLGVAGSIAYLTMCMELNEKINYKSKLYLLSLIPSFHSRAVRGVQKIESIGDCLYNQTTVENLSSVLRQHHKLHSRQDHSQRYYSYCMQLEHEML